MHVRTLGIRIRRRRRVAVALALVLVAAACSGHTTGASNVTSTSAQLNFVGSCGSGEHCSWYVRYRRVGTTAWTKTPTRGPATGPASNVALWEMVNGLTPNLSYEYQACGRAQTNQQFFCVGPDGTANTTSSFQTQANAPALSLTLTPAVGPPTTSTAMNGTGFAAHEAVDIYFDTTDVVLVSADGNGSFANVSVTVPPSAQPGNHWVTAVGRTSGRSAQATFLARTDWAQFHFGATHRGYNPYENTISTANVAQLHEAFTDSATSAASGESLGASSPVVTGGVVYDGSNSETLYAFPASCAGTSCSPLWTGNVDNFSASTPAVAGGTVYVTGGVDPVGHEGGQPVLSAFSTSCGTGGATCSPLWRGALDDFAGTATAPVVSGGMVYAGAGINEVSGVVAAFPASCTPSAGFCDPQWTATTPTPIEDAPAVSGGVVYVGDDAGTLYAFSASCGTGGATCSPLWTASLGAPVHASPAVSNGLVYVGAGNNFYAFPAACGTGGATCTPRWTQTLGGDNAFDSSPAVAGNTVYVGARFNEGVSSNTWLFAFSASTGSPLWYGTTVGSIGASSPAVADGVVYVGDNAGDLFAFGASCGTGGATCSPLWTAATGTDVESSPAVADGTVYVGSNDGNLHAYDLAPAHAAAVRATAPSAATLRPNLALRPR